MRRLLREQERSGLSQARFAEERGVPLSTLTWWRQKLAGASAGAAPTPEGPDLVPVTIRDTLARPMVVEVPGFEVELRSGHVLRISPRFDEAALGRLVRTLEDATC